VKIGQHRVDAGIYLRPRVAPKREHASVLQHVVRFAPEGREIEPVDGLSDGDQIDRVTLETRILGGREPIVDRRMRRSRGQQLATDVRGNDFRKMRSETDCRLSAPGGAIPREIMLTALLMEVVEQRQRITEASPVIGRGDRGEMILLMTQGSLFDLDFVELGQEVRRARSVSYLA